ncbi:hypothetical protein [Robbsia sp. KACC 23696]|uniref:tetratricopeptide repeat protein n=1 Tax=Robbsia sp. KACC 23696 TaxID=3149231 RepID=UPI00325C32E3
MIAKIPRTKASELFETLRGIMRTPSAFELKKWEREAKAGLETDAVMAHQCLGMIAVLRWDVEEVRRRFRAASYLDNAHDVERNLAVALARMNLLDDATAHLEHLFSSGMRSPGILASLAGFYAEAGRLSEAVASDQKYFELTGQENPSAKQRLQLKMWLDDIVGNEVIVQKAHRIVRRFLLERKVHLEVSKAEANLVPSDSWIYITFLVHASVEDAARLDSELTPALFREIEDMPWGSFGVRIEAFEEDMHAEVA